jgi:hypothetical protein
MSQKVFRTNIVTFFGIFLDMLVALPCVVWPDGLPLTRFKFWAFTSNSFHNYKFGHKAEISSNLQTP